MKDIKYAAINAYLNGEGSELEISIKFRLRSDSQLRRWVKVYNTHDEIRDLTSGGGCYMRKARQTTPEEHLEIVIDCITNDKNYGARLMIRIRYFPWLYVWLILFLGKMR